jgi:putative exosortase-associated protein (TIGR04073 family)
MRNNLSFLALITLVSALAPGCANMEQKLGRGMSNSSEIFRMGEMRRTVEQTSVFVSPETGVTTGFVRGLDRSLARTGVGLYEVLTFPFPPYRPVFTSYLAPSPAEPDNFKPGLAADSMYDTDTFIGFSGGDVAPFIPGSRFRIFDTH